jgi:tetratricopeptide (TPR) repeat protein
VEAESDAEVVPAFRPALFETTTINAERAEHAENPDHGPSRARGERSDVVVEHHAMVSGVPIRVKTKKLARHRPTTDDREFARACALWDRGDIRGAFRLFLSLAERGASVAYLNLGYFFDRGLGIQKSEAKALFWYRRAYRNGDASGANNIGTIFRDRGQARRAIAWFSRALRGGDTGAALELDREDADRLLKKLTPIASRVRRAT